MMSRKFVNSALCFVTFIFRFLVSGHEGLTAKSNAVTYVESRDGAHSGSGTRWRRSTMSQQEIDGAVATHNSLRRLEGASDMENMKWNSDLASIALDWANGCNFAHGQPPNIPPTLQYKQIGQNLYATTGTLDSNGAIKKEWYDEKQFFDYNSLSCTPGKACGHYTQVVWASSREVGCAYTLCERLQSTSFTKATYLVCNYGPPGNYGGEKPYKKGKACSNCGNGANWCNEGLCNSECTRSGPGCVCASTCKHCGALNTDTCKCSCFPGWHGSDCSDECKDMDGNCRKGWPPFFCNDTNYGANTRQRCPLMCGICRVGNGTTCGTSSLTHSNYAMSLSFAVVIMTFASMASLTSWTIEFLR